MLAGMGGHTPLKTETGLLAACALAALVSGLATASVAVALAVGLGLYCALQLRALRRLAAALRGRERLDPPFPAGSWHDVYAAVRTLQIRGRKRKRRLKRFVTRFQEAASALPDGVVLLGRDYRVQWRNPAAARLLSLDARACIGVPITAQVDDPLFAAYLREGVFARPLEMPAPGDRRVMLSVLITPFGRRHQHVLVARDITRAYYLDRTRADFVANVSHELRTPLTVLSGNLEILAERGGGGAPAPVPERVVESMRGNVERMRVLVDDLLTLSRLEMGGAERPEGPVNMPALLEGVLRDAQVLCAASGHAVSLDARADLWLRGNAEDLRGAVVNLVSNAIRHTPGRTRVTLRWQGDGGSARLEVADDGPGIAARHLPRLTERFYRVDPARAASSGGTGLGLAIVKHALEQHEATLEIESREGAGTTVRCRFPATRVAPAQPDARAARGAAEPVPPR